MKKIISRSALLLIICLLFAGCGAVQPVTEQMTDEAMEVEEAVEGITKAAEVTENVEETTKAAEAVGEKSETSEASAVEENAESAKAAATDQTSKADSKAGAKTEDAVGKDTVSGNEPAEECKVTVFDAPKTMYPTLALNVRKGPSTDYEVVGHLSLNQAVEITGQADTGWYQLLLDGENAYVSHRYLSETQMEVQVVEAQVQTPAAQDAPAPQAPAQAAVAPAGVIMVGDSRCVQMQAAVGGGGCSWICENSKEYTWFVETAIPRFDQYVGRGTKVVINLGVNDPEHYNDYVATINAKAAEWAGRGAKTYLVSVNPVWENPYTSQEQVDTFNANVPGMLAGVTWIDTASWLNTNGYRVLDGLHYDDSTYINIFNLIMGSL